MTTASSSETVTRTLWRHIDSRAWDRLADVLDPGLRVELVHTGEVLDRDRYVELNRVYPGSWRAAVEDIVSSPNRAVARLRVSNETETFHVASFCTVRQGLVVEMVEVWADGGATPPRRTAPRAVSPDQADTAVDLGVSPRRAPRR